MVLNAIGAQAPSTPEYQPYKFFTQDNVLNAETDAILPRDVLARQGTTLDQLGALVAYHGLSGEVHHAGDETLDAFRAHARAALSARDRYVIINYLRKALGQQIGGHISPLAAYDEKQDKFPDPRRRALQISAGLGVRRRSLRRDEHARRRQRRQDAGLCAGVEEGAVRLLCVSDEIALKLVRFSNKSAERGCQILRETRRQGVHCDARQGPRGDLSLRFAASPS